MTKIKWLEKKYGCVTIWPRFKNFVINPFCLTLLKCAAHPWGTTPEYAPLGHPLASAGIMFGEQLTKLYPRYNLKNFSFPGEEECIRNLLDLDLFWEKDYPEDTLARNKLVEKHLEPDLLPRARGGREGKEKHMGMMTSFHGGRKLE